MSDPAELTQGTERYRWPVGWRVLPRASWNVTGLGHRVHALGNRKYVATTYQPISEAFSEIGVAATAPTRSCGLDREVWGDKDLLAVLLDGVPEDGTGPQAKWWMEYRRQIQELLGMLET